MAIEVPLFKLPAHIAGADLSAKQYRFVKGDSATDFRVVAVTVDGEFALGVLQNKPNAAGVEAEVMIAGVTKLVAAEAITRYAFVGVDSVGEGKIVEESNTGADIGDWILGLALEDAADGDLFACLIGFHNHRVEAA